MKHNRVTINEAFAKSDSEGKAELLRFFAELEMQKKEYAQRGEPKSIGEAIHWGMVEQIKDVLKE